MYTFFLLISKKKRSSHEIGLLFSDFFVDLQNKRSSHKIRLFFSEFSVDLQKKRVGVLEILGGRNFWLGERRPHLSPP